jgi:hypothetical protein
VIDALTRSRRQFVVRAVLLGVLAACSACNPARAFVATPNDYADYRRMRLASTLEDRLAAAWAYLEARPEGRYATRLRAFFDDVEPVFYRVRSRDVAGLEAYLRALPRGPHAGEAMQRLIDARNEARREDLDVRATRATMLRVSADDRSRRQAAEAIADWVRPMLEPAPWLGTFSDAPAEVLARFRLSTSEPVCVREGETERCLKQVVRGFRVRGPDGEVERELRFSVEVRLAPGHRLVGMSLEGKAMARATLEASSAEVASTDDATSWRALIESLGKAIFEDGRACSGGEDAVGVFTLSCEEAAIVLRASRGADEVERIELTRRSGAH